MSEVSQWVDKESGFGTSSIDADPGLVTTSQFITLLTVSRSYEYHWAGKSHSSSLGSNVRSLLNQMINQTSPIIRYALLVCSISTIIDGRVQGEDVPATCTTCHKDQAHQLPSSVHTSLSCQECHKGSDSFSIATDDLPRLISAATQQNQQGTFQHGTDFLGKPSRKEIPKLCGDCHADVLRMNPFGLRTDQLTRYLTSGHGKTLTEKQDDRVAVCTDCHGSHDVLAAKEPLSKTHPTNIPGTCATCHANVDLMAEYGLAVEIVEEYHQSVHGQLLLEQGDTGSPNCATCHGHHSSAPPGFATVNAVCSKCHKHVADNFATSIHAMQEEHKGCVQCHGGGEDRHFHLIERITKPAGILIQRYQHLLQTNVTPTPQQVTEAINPNPRQIINHAISTCTDCHEDLEDDESLPKLFELLDHIENAERTYVSTASRLAKLGQGVLLVDHQRFLFEDAKTHLIELAPLQHTLDLAKVEAKVSQLNEVCEQVNDELDELESGLLLRHQALWPIWAVAVAFSLVLYLKYKQLESRWVKPLPRNEEELES